VSIKYVQLPSPDSILFIIFLLQTVFFFLEFSNSHDFIHISKIFKKIILSFFKNIKTLKIYIQLSTQQDSLKMPTLMTHLRLISP